VACVNLQVFEAKWLRISSFRNKTPPHCAIVSDVSKSMLLATSSVNKSSRISRLFKIKVIFFEILGAMQHDIPGEGLSLAWQLFFSIYKKSSIHLYCNRYDSPH